jgi:hypothetical protein
MQKIFKAFAPIDLAATQKNRNIASWDRAVVARWAHNPKVGGSNPPPATQKLKSRAFCMAFLFSTLPSAVIAMFCLTTLIFYI